MIRTKALKACILFTWPAFTSLIIRPPPNPKPRVNPTTMIVEAFSSILIKFKKGRIHRAISLSIPRVLRIASVVNNPIITI